MTPRSAAERGPGTQPRTAAGRSLLRQWSGHVNEPEVRIVVLAIEAEAATAAVPLDAERMQQAWILTTSPAHGGWEPDRYNAAAFVTALMAEYARLAAPQIGSDIQRSPLVNPDYEAASQGGAGEGETLVIHKRQSVNGCVTCNRKWSDHSIQERSLR